MSIVRRVLAGNQNRLLLIRKEIPGQEILTRDKVSIRVNAWAEFQGHGDVEVWSGPARRAALEGNHSFEIGVY